MKRFKVSSHDIGKRLDVFVVEQMPTLSRAFVHKLCDQGKMLVNDQQEKHGYRLRQDDKIAVNYDLAQLGQIPSIDIPVLYEDKECVVINKPVGLLTHSKGVFNPEPTVATWLSQRLNSSFTGSDSVESNQRDGIVHRLDRATSGVMICAKTRQAQSWLQKQFSSRKVHKTYIAIIEGALEPTAAIIDMPIERNPKKPQTFRVGANGKPSITEYETLSSNEHYSLVKLSPQTGRTHQLRVHLKQQGHPIVGDTLYDGQPAERLFLHALSLELTLLNKSRQTFEAPLPPDFENFMKDEV
ncbi:MAG TPA: RluA family pseudouridine synthase [Patescibacteria group bacterium]|nr:RluA family pseudouridine synthase [Patescibacteria group bacterium]